MSEIMIALGGNAILRHRERGTARDQLGHIWETSKHLVDLVAAGNEIVVTHGNGPQVGDILLKEDLARNRLPPMPLDICGAMSQGMIGYMMQRCLDQAFVARGLAKPVATIITQVRVDRTDPAFENPTKFIGPYYTEIEAQRLASTQGWIVEDDSGKGYRRVVPSPEPAEVLELDEIRTLLDAGVVVIAGGGGGVPVVESADGQISGVEAVIDKDYTAELLAGRLDAQILLILTDVSKVAIDYARPEARELDHMTIDEAKRYLAQGQFPEGNMGPKVESCVRFVERTGRPAIITALETAEDALAGRAGTRIER